MRRSSFIVMTGAATLALLAVAGAAQAQEFFGEDLNNSATVRVAHPNSDAARNAFFAQLTGVGTEDFESYATGATAPLAINFGLTTATITGTGAIETVANPTATNGFGRYPISGQNFWSSPTAGNDFVINFTNPIAAFGFYGVDVGDFGGQLTLTLAGGTTEVVTVPNTIGNSGSTDGSVLYFGLIRLGGGITSIAFNNNSTGDVFAFDDMTVGVRQQVLLPLPSAALAGMGTLAGIAGFGGLRRRRA